jgi:hypothetical protein
MMRTQHILASVALAAAMSLLACKTGRADKPSAARPSNRLGPVFSGKELAFWRVRSQDKPHQWSAQQGVLVSAGPGPDLLSETVFRDFALHLEYKVSPRGRGGVFLRGRHEVRIADDAGAAPGFLSSGAIANLICPSLNAALKAGQWQTMDVTVVATTVTVILNGKKVIPEILMLTPTAGALDQDVRRPGPIMLRGGAGSVSFRNLRIKSLPPATAAVPKPVTYGATTPPPAALNLDVATRDQFDKAHPGVLPEMPVRTRLPFPSAPTFTWTSLNQDFFVHDQGPSSSCWANTAIEALECNWLIRNGTRHPFSPQPILDHTQRPNGGNAAIAFDVLLKRGTARLFEYTFAGPPGKFRPNIETKFRAAAWGVVGDGRTPPTVKQVKAALLEHGPLAINLFSTPTFVKYTKGVFAEHYQPRKNEQAANHEVLLLGWDDKRGKGAWYIKNSWGEKWGDRGYGWIEYGSNNVCHSVWWVRAQSTYYALPKDRFRQLVPDAAPPTVWTSPIAPIAEVASVRMEHNVVQGNQKGMIFHIKAQFRRAMGKKTLVSVYLLNEASKFLPIRTADRAYAGNQGHLRISKQVVPGFLDTTYQDIALFLPYSQLPLRSGKNLFRFQVYAAADGQWLAMNYVFKGEFFVTHQPPRATTPPR